MISRTMNLGLSVCRQLVRITALLVSADLVLKDLRHLDGAVEGLLRRAAAGAGEVVRGTEFFPALRAIDEGVERRLVGVRVRQPGGGYAAAGAHARDAGVTACVDAEGRR